MTDDAKKEPAAPKPGKYTAVLMVIFSAIFLIVIIVSFSLIIYLHTKKPAEPKNMIIYGDMSDPAVYGATESDLERAMELSKGWVGSQLRGNHDAGSAGISEMGEMIMSGRIGEINSQTRCVLLNAHRSVCEVRISEGPMRGLNCWVHRKSLGPAKQYSKEYGIGLMCFRYVITALICALGLYFLRIKSILLQLLGFIIGMVILNVLWVKIASALMFY